MSAVQRWQLAQANEALQREAEARDQLEEDMKQAFMRGPPMLGCCLLQAACLSDRLQCAAHARLLPAASCMSV